MKLEAKLKSNDQGKYIELEIDASDDEPGGEALSTYHLVPSPVGFQVIGQRCMVKGDHVPLTQGVWEFFFPSPEV